MKHFKVKHNFMIKPGTTIMMPLALLLNPFGGVIRMHPFIGLRSCWKVAKNPNLLHGGSSFLPRKILGMQILKVSL
jgi:hypothetical protein